MPRSTGEISAILDGPDMKREMQAYEDTSIDPREVPRYALTEVALFLHLPENTLRSWVSGRTFPARTTEGYSAPLIAPADHNGAYLSFYNLIEAHILKSTRRRDEVPMKFIREAIDYVDKQHPSPHPLISAEFETDGKYTCLLESSKVLLTQVCGGN